MKLLPTSEEMHLAFRTRDASYEGIFVTGVKTTGIFCRPACPAKKPNPENIEFFPDNRSALKAGYRPCKRCKPLQADGHTPGWVQTILDETEKDPSRRWTDEDISDIGLHPNRLRRWFKKHHQITFQEYLRLRRLGNALGQIKHGKSVSQTAYSHDYESLSGFRDAMKNWIGKPVNESAAATIVYINRITTPLGLMIACTTKKELCLLEFADRRMLETQLKKLVSYLNCVFVPGSNEVTEFISSELDAYFKGELKTFSVPLLLPGTDFQKAVWKQLQTIPYAQTRSYQEQARSVGNEQAVRAVARANGENRLAIVIPCHRVIGKDGKLTGYGGGLWRKKRLLSLERNHDQTGTDPNENQQTELFQPDEYIPSDHPAKNRFSQ
jgi:AraC family transcriptional regulator, regulatory protein of adaptative response / methylated-DNA-[protein]-cysteine methyltransferase